MELKVDLGREREREREKIRKNKKKERKKRIKKLRHRKCCVFIFVLFQWVCVSGERISYICLSIGFYFDYKTETAERERKRENFEF